MAKHMDFQYVPDTSSVGKLDFRPYMVEVAWNYCQLVLQSAHKRGMIEQTLAALAIEVVLKSFNAVVAGNAGRIDETYEFKPKIALPKGADRHNLIVLANALRPDIRGYLIEHIDEEVLREHQGTFSHSRYFYEPTAPKSSSDAAMKLAVKLICKTLFLYKQRQCDDPFVARFDVNAVFFTYVQRYAILHTGAA